MRVGKKVIDQLGHRYTSVIGLSPSLCLYGSGSVWERGGDGEYIDPLADMADKLASFPISIFPILSFVIRR